MDINISTHPSQRAAYVKTDRSTAQAEKSVNPYPSARSQDEFSISPEAREAERTNSASAVSETKTSAYTAFPSFSEEFNKVTQNYFAMVQTHYAQEHEENLTFDNPANHIWNKYKNPDSSDFRADLSEDERAWAYDQELDLLNGGKHMQIYNPYVFNTPPTLSTAAMQANQACRERIDRCIENIFAENGIEIPADVSFRLTVDSGYTIHVTGLEDEESAASIEQALNTGSNGKNLYNHLKITSPDSKNLGINYTNGHLEPIDIRQELDDTSLAEVKNQTCPAYVRYSDSYDPHRKALMNDEIIGLNVDKEWLAQHNTPEAIDRANSSIRVYGPEIIAQVRTGALFPDRNELLMNRYADVDPGGLLAVSFYVQAYAQQGVNAKKTIEEYYSAAHRENSSYPFAEGVQHIKEKYRLPDSISFRSDLTPAQRDMYYRQEMALLTGAPLTMQDPFALASIGGVQTAEAMHSTAVQAVIEKLEELRRQKINETDVV